MTTTSAVETTLVLAGMPAPVIDIPGCTPRTEGLPSISVSLCVLPNVVSVKPETSNQPNLIVPPGNPGCVTRMRLATCAMIGGTQSPEVG